MTTDQVTSLKQNLQSMMDNISRRDPIVDQLTEIARLQAEIAPTAPPQLTHFLERRSYAKALEFLDQGYIVDDPDRPECDEEEAHP